MLNSKQADDFVLNKISEDKLISKFTDLYKDYSPKNIDEYIEDLYDKEVYFIDPIHQVGGLNNVKKYFHLMAKPIESCRFEINSILNEKIIILFVGICT